MPASSQLTFEKLSVKPSIQAHANSQGKKTREPKRCPPTSIGRLQLWPNSSPTKPAELSMLLNVSNNKIDTELTSPYPSLLKVVLIQSFSEGIVENAQRLESSKNSWDFTENEPFSGEEMSEEDDEFRFSPIVLEDDEEVCEEYFSVEREEKMKAIKFESKSQPSLKYFDFPLAIPPPPLTPPPAHLLSRSLGVPIKPAQDAKPPLLIPRKEAVREGNVVPVRNSSRKPKENLMLAMEPISKASKYVPQKGEFSPKDFISSLFSESLLANGSETALFSVEMSYAAGSAVTDTVKEVTHGTGKSMTHSTVKDKPQVSKIEAPARTSSQIQLFKQATTTAGPLLFSPQELDEILGKENHTKNRKRHSQDSSILTSKPKDKEPLRKTRSNPTSPNASQSQIVYQTLEEKKRHVDDDDWLVRPSLICGTSFLADRDLQPYLKQK